MRRSVSCRKRLTGPSQEISRRILGFSALNRLVSLGIDSKSSKLLTPMRRLAAQLSFSSFSFKADNASSLKPSIRDAHS
jgi:hypothetical protein